MPPFHGKAIASYHDLIVALTHEVTGIWRAGEVHYVCRRMRALTLRNSTSALFGYQHADALRVSALLYAHGQSRAGPDSGNGHVAVSGG
jgi:cytochrome P450